MTSLFSTHALEKTVALESSSTPAAKKQKTMTSESRETSSADGTIVNSVSHKSVETFADLGVCEWLCDSVAAMGFKKPSPIQAECIPAILHQRDVLGCAETGSGKTAAFALPILQELSQDPYGIFAVVLTPTRELAMQISEQFLAFGATFNVKVCLVIGGSNIMAQQLQLSKMPHIVIGTPGRVRHHLESAMPPKFNRVKYLVLDEGDRLMSPGFQAELKVISDACPDNTKRRTLIFSATLTDSLAEIEKLTMRDTLYFNLSLVQKVPESIRQEYIFMPAQLKLTYLVAALTYILYPAKAIEMLSFGSKKRQKVADKDKQLKMAAEASSKRKRSNDINNAVGASQLNVSSAVASILNSEYPEYFENLAKQKQQEERDRRNSNSLTSGGNNNGNSLGGENGGTKEYQNSIVIFVNTCKRCEEVTQVLNELGFNAVGLHSIMPQDARSAAISKFKSYVSRILVATDVASRGLDIPYVDIVINEELPSIISDYVHRIGRTGRNQRAGLSLSLLSPHEIAILHAIEKHTEIKMTMSGMDIAKDETAIIPYISKVSKVIRTVELKLLENGFDEKLLRHQDRKKQASKDKRDKDINLSGSSGTGNGTSKSKSKGKTKGQSGRSKENLKV